MEELKSKELEKEVEKNISEQNGETKEKHGLKIFWIFLIIIALILLYIYFFFTQREALRFSLIGEKKVIIEAGDEFNDPGFIATINESSITSKVNITSNLNTANVGEYTIKYNLKIFYLGIDELLTRTIIVQDTTKPELTVNCDDVIDMFVGEEFETPTYTAIDNYDGDITQNVVIESNLNTQEKGTYQIIYTVADSSNNEASKTITINVKKPKNAHIVVYISKQILQYYEYDEVVLTSNVVTGINGKTPTGTFKVLNKATNLILRGDGYASFVNYWIAFKGHSFGFHDASWRSSFGGQIYKTNGSHGCVNMPYSNVKKLYSLVSVGTPVYIYN